MYVIKLNAIIAMSFFSIAIESLDRLQRYPENGCTLYSAKVNVITATSAGRNSITEIQEQMNAGTWPAYGCKGLKASMKYAYSAPERGTTVLNSAKANAPNRDSTPQLIQTIKQNPTDPDRSKALVGDTKMPEPEQ